MSITGIPTSYALPMYGAQSPYVAAPQGYTAVPQGSAAALGVSNLGQQGIASRFMNAIKSALTELGLRRASTPTPMPLSMSQGLLPTTSAISTPRPAARKARPKKALTPAQKRARARAAARRKTALMKQRTAAAAVAAQRISGTPQSLPAGQLGMMPGMGINPGMTGGTGLLATGAGSAGASTGPQINATNQSGLAGGTNPLNQHVTNDNHYTSEGYSMSENPYGAWGGVGGINPYGMGSPVLGWNNPYNLQPSVGGVPYGGYGASMSGAGMLPQAQSTGLLSRIFGG